MLQVVIDSFSLRFIITWQILYQISRSGRLTLKEKLHKGHISEFTHYLCIFRTDICVQNITHIRLIWLKINIVTACQLNHFFDFVISGDFTTQIIYIILGVTIIRNQSITAICKRTRKSRC